MTFVVERSVSIDTPGSDVRSVHDDGRLVLSTAGRSVTFDTHVGVARVVEDTHQPGSASATEIPTEIRDHVLTIGYRIHGNACGDGGFQLLRGDER